MIWLWDFEAHFHFTVISRLSSSITSNPRSIECKPSLKMTTEIDYASSTLSFPQKLYALMERESGDCVIWERGGLCFRITDQATFSKEIVPRYFKRK